MTKDELKDYLKAYRENVHAVNITVYLDRLNYLEEFKNDYAIRQEYDCVLRMIKRERKELQAQTAVIVSWSKLITDELHRDIFIDKCVNGLSISELEDKYHYSRTSLFNIYDKCCKEISRKCVRDLHPDCKQEAVTI